MIIIYIFVEREREEREKERGERESGERERWRLERKMRERIRRERGERIRRESTWGAEGLLPPLSAHGLAQPGRGPP